MKKFAALSALVLSVAAPAFAADDAKSLYERAVQAYEARADLVRNDEVIQLLEDAKKLPADTDLKYNILVLQSRAVYWKGINSKSNDDKKVLFLRAHDLALDATKESDDYAEGHYFAAIALGRWGEANGVLASLQKAPVLLDLCRKAQERVTMDGELGETVDSYGPSRTLGRVYFKLPTFAGGSMEKARQYLEDAATKAPEHVLNITYFAEVLNGGNASDKARARRMLDELLAKTPEQINPRRLPEMVDELNEARQLRASMGN